MNNKFIILLIVLFFGLISIFHTIYNIKEVYENNKLLFIISIIYILAFSGVYGIELLDKLGLLDNNPIKND